MHSKGNPNNGETCSSKKSMLKTYIGASMNGGLHEEAQQAKPSTDLPTPSDRYYDSGSHAKAKTIIAKSIPARQSRPQKQY